MIKRNFEKIGLVCTYLLGSVLTTVFNKYIVSNLQFEMLFFYLGLQSLFVSLALFILSLLKITTIRPLTIKKCSTWFPCAVLLTLMIYSSTKTMKYLTISLFTLLKDFTIIIVCTSEFFLYRRQIDIYTVSAFVLILFSSSLGQISEKFLCKFGLLWCCINIASTSSYILLYKYNILIEKSTNSESVFYSNFLSIPCLLIGCIFLDNVDVRLLSLNAESLHILIIIALSSISAFFISYSTAWCLRLLSSTSYSMLGAINKTIVSFSGMIFIGENNFCKLKLFSLMLGSLAGIIYSKRVINEE